MSSNASLAKISLKAFFVLSFFCLIAAPVAADAARSVVIEKVFLKSDSGEWLLVAEPDHAVDLLKTQPGVSFFNSNRIPAGKYSNFKVIFLESAEEVPMNFSKGLTGNRMQVYAKQDLSELMDIQRNSFIGLWFTLDQTQTDVRRIRQLELYIDQLQKNWISNDLIYEPAKTTD